MRGQVRTPLDESTVRDALALFRREGVEAVAVCFMHSYAEPAHERRAAELVQELAPELFLAVSSEILPQVRLNERAGTTVMSAYVGPVLRGYIERLIAALAEASLRRDAARDAVERRRRDAGGRGPEPGRRPSSPGPPAAPSPRSPSRAPAGRTTASSSTWAARASTPPS